MGLLEKGTNKQLITEGRNKEKTADYQDGSVTRFNYRWLDSELGGESHRKLATSNCVIDSLNLTLTIEACSGRSG